jgi:Mrp family chromosome partitioning ATPase
LLRARLTKERILKELLDARQILNAWEKDLAKILGVGENMVVLQLQRKLILLKNNQRLVKVYNVVIYVTLVKSVQSPA